jgi:hypothetical protein
MNEKNKSASPSAVQVENRGKSVGSGEKLSVIMRREKGERTVDMCRNVTLAHGTVRKFRVNADRITESAQPGTEVFVKQGYRSRVRTKTVDVGLLLFIVLEILSILSRNALYCIQMYIYFIHSTCILYRSVCPLME